jgi:hypothetical protein
MVRTVAVEQPNAIILYCTNWKCLRLIGEPTSAGGRWGSLFTDKRFG